MPVPIDVVGELAGYLESRGLDADPENARNQRAFLLGKASDLDVAPNLARASRAGDFDAKAGIAANTLYDQRMHDR